ncbi:ABC transporter ATP-binding protein [Amycolatopsis palatopharyngis]|uniref:ABC transporter ATP-binding protein n=1 Tax=Amycolatopsis palatopharyngis TaxID=187982 RepID=UPI000E22F8C8|nr:ATP-binding cassette domain-containing protein [Amycolatopsis palatopharyngis]
MPSPEHVFDLHEVGVDYVTPAGVVSGVHDVTLAVPSAGITVLAGPSGSGKSTLLRVLGLFEQPARGRLCFRGTDVGGLGHAGRRAIRRRDLSQVFQNPTDNLLDYLSAGKNLRAAAESANRDCDSEALLDQLGLGGTASWPVTALSGGQQQRLAFGCALARGSSVILADEPTSQLDEQSADLVLDTLRDLARHDVALVVTSHDERLIELGTRVVRLTAGRVDENGDP